MHDITRASSVSLRRHPCTYQFHVEARLIDHAKCRWLVDSIWNYELHIQESVLSESTDEGSELFL